MIYNNFAEISKEGECDCLKYYIKITMSKYKLEGYDFEEVLLALGINEINDINNIEELKKVLKKLGSNYITVSLVNIQDLLKPYGFYIVKLEKEKTKIMNGRFFDELDEETKNKVENIDAEIQENKARQKIIYEQKDEFHKTEEVLMNGYLLQFDNLTNNLYNNLMILYQIMNLKCKLIEQLEIKKENESLNNIDVEKKIKDREIIVTLSEEFKNQDEFIKYIYENLIIRENSDWNNRDLSLRVKNSNPSSYIYGLESIEPKEKLNYKTEIGEIVKVYEIGKFTYATCPSLSFGKFSKTSNTFDVLTILRNDGNGDLRIYNGVMYINDFFGNDLDFYANIVFSDINMENAMNNNFGYIGNVKINRNQSNRRLSYDELDIDETINALYIANNYPNRNEHNINLPNFYKRANALVELKEKLEEKRANNQNNLNDLDDDDFRR